MRVERPLTRRGLLASGMAGAAVALAGCAARNQRPSSAARVRTIPFQLNVQGPRNASVNALVQQYVDRNFNASHRGIRAVYEPWGNMPAVISAAVAGAGPYVISGCCNDFATALPFLAPLDSFLRRDNIATDIWSTGQLQTFRQPAGLYGVPAYTAAQPYFYRQDILDELGLSYPDPNWTAADAAKLWKACVADKGGKHRYGATLDVSPGFIGEGAFLLHGFGGAFMDQTGTKCLFDLPGSIQGGQWAFDLIHGGVATNRGHWPGGELAGMWLDACVFSEGAGGAMLSAVNNLGSKFKWDLIPYPRWPVRPATAVQIDFYGLNATVPPADHDLAWELFRIATVDPGWTRYVMRLTLQQPALLSQWDEWETVVRAAAPVLRGKAIGYWKQAAVDGWGYGLQFFKYAPLQAFQIIATTWTQLWNRQIDVQTGFRSIAQQIDALEQADASVPTPGAQEIIQAHRKLLQQLRGMFA